MEFHLVRFTERQGEALGPLGLKILHALALPTNTAVVHVERVCVPAKFRGRVHKHPTAGVNIMLSGSATHYYGDDLQAVEVNAGDIFHVPADQPHTVTSLSGCVAVEVRLGQDGVEFLPELDALWEERYGVEWQTGA